MSFVKIGSALSLIGRFELNYLQYLHVVMIKSEHRYSEECQENVALYCTLLLRYELESA